MDTGAFNKVNTERKLLTSQNTIKNSHYHRSGWFHLVFDKQITSYPSYQLEYFIHNFILQFQTFIHCQLNTNFSQLTIYNMSTYRYCLSTYSYLSVNLTLTYHNYLYVNLELFVCQPNTNSHTNLTTIFHNSQLFINTYNYFFTLFSGLW